MGIGGGLMNKQNSKKFISCFLVICLFMTITAVPVHADYTSQISNYWEQFCLHMSGTSQLLADIAGSVCNDVCSSSPDHLHHNTSFHGTPDMVQSGHDSTGWYTEMTCAYCGKKFKAYSSDFEKSYDDYVSSLPSGGFGRDSSGAGYLIWYPNGTLSYSSSSSDVQITHTNNSFSAYSKDTHNYVYAYCEMSSDKFPITGIYSDACIISNPNAGSGGLGYNNSHSKGNDTGTLTIHLTCIYHQTVSTSYKFAYKLIPTGDFTSYNNIYSSSARVNNIVNNYAYQTTENNYSYINNSPLFDETTLVFTNPITGQQVNINDWWYDYITRTYTLKYTDNGTSKTSTINYGDSNITVTDSGNTYNYYYYKPCTHDYQVTNTVAPTCTQVGSNTFTCTKCNDTYSEVIPALGHDYILSDSLSPTCTQVGSNTYTCSRCNDTYSEVIPALGHDWIKGETIPTVYDTDGTTVITQGYTVYTCSRCGEIYHDETGTGPPATSTATSENTTWLQRIYNKLCDILKAIGKSPAGKSIWDFLTSLVDAIKELIDKISLDWLYKLFQGLGDLANTIVQFLIDAFKEIFGSVLYWLLNAIKSIVHFFSFLLTWFGDLFNAPVEFINQTTSGGLFSFFE